VPARSSSSPVGITPGGPRPAPQRLTLGPPQRVTVLSLCTDSDVILQSNIAFSYTRDENPFFGQTGADRSPTVGFFTQFGGAALTDAVGSHTLQHRCDDPDSGAVNCTHHLTTQPK
jgi:hypothetical protein